MGRGADRDGDAVRREPRARSRRRRGAGPLAAGPRQRRARRRRHHRRGDVALTLSLLAIGAVGVVGTSTHWTGPETGEMITAFDKGDVQRAREINARLIESYLFENSDTCVFSQSIKAMMRTLGLRVGECRLPLGPAPEGTEDRAREVWKHLHA